MNKTNNPAPQANGKTYEVELTRHPEKFTVTADNPEEAVRKAKEQADFSTYSVEGCEEIEPTFYCPDCGTGGADHTNSKYDCEGNLKTEVQKYLKTEDTQG